jgi:hypothetical protein
MVLISQAFTLARRMNLSSTSSATRLWPVGSEGQWFEHRALRRHRLSSSGVTALHLTSTTSANMFQSLLVIARPTQRGLTASLVSTSPAILEAVVPTASDRVKCPIRSATSGMMPPALILPRLSASVALVCDVISYLSDFQDLSQPPLCHRTPVSSAGLEFHFSLQSLSTRLSNLSLTPIAALTR